MTQPLDVAFFRPMKEHWRAILAQWKAGAGSRESSIPKSIFPRLLKKLMNRLEEKGSDNIRSGFEKCGIIPLNSSKVLERLPSRVPADDTSDANQSVNTNEDLNSSLKELLTELRYGEAAEKRQRNKKIKVPAGKSVSRVDFGASESDDSLAVDEPDEELDANTVNNSSNMDDDITSVNTSNNSNNMRVDATRAAICATFRGKLYQNVIPLEVTELNVSDWVLVAFDPENASTSSKTFNYIGKIIETDRGLYKGVFLRSKITKVHQGHIFREPDIKDETWFRADQVIGKLVRPEKYGRGLFKFEINVNQM